MAFSSSITKRTVMGDMRVNMGEFSQESGDTGGNIDTGLSKVFFFTASAEIDDTSDSSGTITMSTEDPGADQDGYWIAIGY